VDLTDLDDEALVELATMVGLRKAWSPRPEQMPPDRNPEFAGMREAADWFVWLFRAGRGSGKTRSAAQWLAEEIEWRGPLRAVLVGPTFADGRDTMMEGESGLLRCLSPWLMPHGRDRHWNRSLGEAHLADGSYVRVHSSERASRLRGPQWHLAWVDEPAEFRDADLGIAADTTWFNLMAGLRLGDAPKVVVTGTPKPVKLIKELVERCDTHDHWFESRSSTYANLHNLAPAFRDEVVAMYEGTSLGRQELEGELVEGGGDVFDPAWLRLIAEPPGGRRMRVRCWDLAATEPHDGNRDPDWTVGALMSLDLDSRDVAIEHIARWRARPGRRDEMIRATAIRDRNVYGESVRVAIEQEPGAGGVAQIDKLMRDLDGIARVEGVRLTGSKFDRAMVAAAAMEQGRVSVVEPRMMGDEPEWDLRAFTQELREFRADDRHAHDDQIDAVSMLWLIAPPRRQVIAASPLTESKAPNRL
jgi:predicted phage terminase large subunit-like protein